MVLSPACSCSEGTDQSVRFTVPLSKAVPFPPRALLHLTRYTHRLSPATPDSPAKPLALTSLTCVMTTVGATLSLLFQRSRSACSSSGPSRTGSLLCRATDDSSTPPQAERAMRAMACATNTAVFFLRMFIPNEYFYGDSSIDRIERVESTHRTTLGVQGNDPSNRCGMEAGAVTGYRRERRQTKVCSSIHDVTQREVHGIGGLRRARNGPPCM